MRAQGMVQKEELKGCFLTPVFSELTLFFSNYNVALCYNHGEKSWVKFAFVELFLIYFIFTPIPYPHHT